MIIKYSNQLKIVNLEQLPRGTGAKYIEALIDEMHDVYIAIRWRRKQNIQLPYNHALIELS